LAVPKLNPIANTFDELADKYPQQKITLEAHSVMADMFMVGVIQYFSMPLFPKFLLTFRRCFICFAFFWW